MATQLFFWGPPSVLGTPGMYTGTNTAKLDGTTSGWAPSLIHLNRSGSGGISTAQVTTVTGATNGVEFLDGSFGVPNEFFTLPLAANVTISGTITLNLWGYENNMSANAAINCKLERVDCTGAIVSQIAKTARVTELGTSPSAANFTVTPTSTNMLKGERIRVTVFIDDAGTMGSGFTGIFDYDIPAAGAGTDGDSYVTFTETFTFQTTDPAGTTLYLTNVAGPAVGANTELEMWTSRGGTATSAVVNSVNSWTAPIQWTDTAGGTAVEWYSKQLSAFTLDGLVRVNARTLASAPSTGMALRASLFICDSSGSILSTWGAATIVDAATIGGVTPSTIGLIDNTQARSRGWLAGPSTAITSGQRLMLRLYVDDTATGGAVSGRTLTLKYNGPTLDADGDSYITLPQSVTEAVAATSAPPLPFQRRGSWRALRTR